MTALTRKMAAGLFFGTGVTPDADEGNSWRWAVGYSYLGNPNVLFTEQQRRMAAGIPFIPLTPSMAPDADKDAFWRAAVGHSYHFDTGVEEIDGGTANLTLELSLAATFIPEAAPSHLVIGVGGGGGYMAPGGRLLLPKTKIKMPTLFGMSEWPQPTAPRRPPEVKPVAIEPEPTEAELLEERWRAWQESPAAKGKGSASILEFMVWEFLVRRKKQIEDVDFIYQYPLAGGRTQFGGFVADFYFPLRAEVWNPAGQQFHWTKSRDRARDIMSRAVLASRGIREIFLWEEDMLARPDYTLEQAWLGRELPHGVV